MRRLGILAAVVCVTQLAGCWFVFIPGSLIQKASDSITGAEGEHCVGRHVKVGDRLTDSSGRVGTVQSLSGTSVRCSEEGRPIRAAISF